MSKSREEKEAQAREQQAQESRRQAEQERAAAQEAERRITEAGKPTAEETTRLARYKEKAVTPGETLMTQTGPIAQAVARRVQERVEAPGMDYDPATTMGVLGPELWRGLKQRGIAPPPGAEGGGGLGTQQYMKGALPTLAQLRQQQISEDITRGQQYGTEARGLQTGYEDLERILAEALSQRRYGAVATGAPYGYYGAQDYGRGMREAAGMETEYAAQRAEQQRQKRAQEEEAIRAIVEAIAIAASGGAATPAVMAGRAIKPGATKGGGITAPSLRMEETPYWQQLATRRAGRY
jgi:hypothetical protein